MAKPNLQQQMYASCDPSVAQRAVLAASLGTCVVLAWWLLLGGGIAVVWGWFGWIYHPGDWIRRISLTVALSIYFLRVLFTDFVFLKRGVSWAEAITIAPWVFTIYVLLALSSGTNPAPFGVAGEFGIVLFIAGSWINSHAEYQRHVWKKRPENHGKLYTRGMFRVTRHPNYFGDLLSFSGLCWLSGRWFTAIIPVLMLAGFVFVNVPALDAHLREHYGRAFEDYASRTRKLIPYIY